MPRPTLNPLVQNAIVPALAESRVAAHAINDVACLNSLRPGDQPWRARLGSADTVAALILWLENLIHRR